MEEAVRTLSVTLALLMVSVGVGATVNVGTVSCSGTAPNETCSVGVTCDNGDCTITENNYFHAQCIPFQNTTTDYTLIASHNNQGPNPECSFNVGDNDGSIVVTIDSSDGLPVELVEFTID